MSPWAPALLLASLLPSTAAAGACGGPPPADAPGAPAGPLPGLGALRDSILAAAQEAGRSDVSCDPVSKGTIGEGLQCYHGNQVALIGQAPRVLEEGPTLVASFGDGVERRVEKDGVFVKGRRWAHLNGSPVASVLRARQLFCETVVSGNPQSLVVPIKNEMNGEGPQAVPAIHYAPKEEAPRLYRI